MKVNAGKLQILTVAAMLVIVSGGIAAYAQAQSSSSTPSSASSSTSTSTAAALTTVANQTLCQPPTPTKVGRLVLPITATGSTSTGSISFSNSRGCLATITTVGGVFNVQIALRYAKPVTEYNVVLVANGTSYTLGNMVTGQGGNGQLDNQVLLTTGTYVVSIQIYDTSSSPGQSTLVLSTGQGTIVSPPFPTASSGQPGPGVAQGQHGQPGVGQTAPGGQDPPGQSGQGQSPTHYR